MTISAFIETLEPEHQEQYEVLLQIGKGGQEGFPEQLKEARNTLFHYPKLIFGQEAPGVVEASNDRACE